ncbi:Putative ribonuclease H protein At1g65750 [Linum perenne]
MCQGAGCEFCHAGEENSSHVLRECSFADEVWKEVLPDAVSRPDWTLPFVEWLEVHLNSNVGLQFGIVNWYLWRTRNERLFASGKDSPSVVAAKASNWIRTVSSAMARDATLDSDNGAARQSARGKAAAGGLIRDSEGRCLDAYTVNLGICSITRAEIRGAIEGIRRAWRAGYRRLEVQLDSSAAVAILLNQETSLAHQYALEVWEFRDLIQREWTVNVRHVYREANHAADYLASIGHYTPRGTFDFDISDCNLAYFIRYDCMGISEPRMIK